MKKSQIFGAIILMTVIVAGIGIKKIMTPDQAKHVFKGYVGGEKIGFLKNEKIQDILRKKYNIRIDYTKAGSIEMVREDSSKMDFVWPSNQVALEIYKNGHKKLVKSEIIFNSPIVLYSWDLVTQALIKKGIVRRIKSSYYIENFKELIDLVVQQKKWTDIGIKELYGKISIVSTDPTKSNSGNMFLGLLSIMIHGDMVSQKHLPEILPVIQNVFRRLGHLHHSSGDLFDQYLRTGVGAKPIIAGYENQIIEFSQQYADFWPKIKQRVRILYPYPTVWSSHPIIIINPQAKILIEALKDKEIQRIAWEKHGFRTGLMGVTNDPAILGIMGIPENIEKVVSMPSAGVMEKMIEALSQ